MQKLDYFPFANQVSKKWEVPLSEGSFLLIEAPLDPLRTHHFAALLKGLKKRGINPILCSDLKDKQQWLEHPLIVGSLTRNEVFSPTTNSSFESLLPKDSYTGFFTSGSTGSPKLIIHSDNSLQLSAEESLSAMKLAKEELILSALPFFHLGGFLQLVRKYQQGFNVEFCDPAELYQKWSDQKPSAVIGVPTQMISGLERGCPPTLFYSGGAKFNENQWQKALDQGYELMVTYGLTESAGAIMYQRKPNESFEYYPSARVQISSNKKLSFTSKRLAKACLRGPLLEVEIWPPLHLYETQDLASIEEINQEGQNIRHLTIHGRSDRVVICAGENIDPIEIVEVVTKNYSFNQVFFRGFSHPKLGQIPVLFVEGLPVFKGNNQEKDQKEWLESFKKHFSREKRPRLIIELPKYTGIKPSKEELLHHYQNKEDFLYYDL